MKAHYCNIAFLHIFPGPRDLLLKVRFSPKFYGEVQQSCALLCSGGKVQIFMSASETTAAVTIFQIPELTLRPHRCFIFNFVIFLKSSQKNTPGRALEASRNGLQPLATVGHSPEVTSRLQRVSQPTGKGVRCEEVFKNQDACIGAAGYVRKGVTIKLLLLDKAGLVHLSVPTQVPSHGTPFWAPHP